MLVLALDTTTTVSSCAVARDGVVLREDAGDASKPQAVRLPGDLAALVEGIGITLPEVDVFAVATGPGSFTGLRIGIATMQGLAFAGGKPLIGISGFDALARSASAGPLTPPEGGTADATGHIATWVDAWRGEVYASLYENGRQVETPVVAAPQDLLARFAKSERCPIAFVGNAAETYRDLIRRSLGDRARIADPAAPLLAGVIARLATAAATRGHALPAPHAIRPLYVRRPDAELARAQKVP